MMQYRSGLLVALLLMAPAVAVGRDTDSFRWSSIRDVADFQPLRVRLQRLVDANGVQRVNRICVIGQQPSAGYRAAYVYWPAMNKLILWEPSRDDPDDIAHSRRYLDLAKDVVSGGDVGGSIYLVTRTWARSVITACNRHGETLTIVRSGDASR